MVIFPVTVYWLVKNIREKCKGRFKKNPDLDYCAENEETWKQLGFAPTETIKSLTQKSTISVNTNQ